MSTLAHDPSPRSRKLYDGKKKFNGEGCHRNDSDSTPLKELISPVPGGGRRKNHSARCKNGGGQIKLDGRWGKKKVGDKQNVAKVSGVNRAPDWVSSYSQQWKGGTSQPMELGRRQRNAQQRKQSESQRKA